MTHVTHAEQRIAALSPARRAVLVRRLQARAAAAPAQSAPDPRLVAYVVPARGADLDEADMRAYLERRLPAHMVPSTLVLLDALPLTPNGKLDRAALPDPSGARDGADGFVEPRDDLELAIAGLWCELLGLDAVSVHDDFFELGGHSLLVARLLARVRDQLGADVPLAQFFQRPTVAGLAEHIGAVRWAAGAAPAADSAGELDEFVL